VIDPSAMRTVLTVAPAARRPSESAELKVAKPHRVGGWVLSTPIVGETENPWCVTGFLRG